VRWLLDALGVPPQRIPVDLAARVGLYRSALAGRRILVVLDNAADADQVRPLLPGSPGSMALITSRNQLSGLVSVEGAYRLTLDVLSVEEARCLLAARVGPSRLVAEPSATNEIIGRCGGLPLALAVVAARVMAHPQFSLASLASGLAEANEALDAFADADPAIDVRAVFSWSYRALTPGAARLFRLLGLHAGPDIAAAAAASLVGLPLRRVRPLLAELAGAHLIAEHVPGRYAFHDLLRSYGAELAHTRDSPVEQRAALERVLDYYVHTAHSAARLLNMHREPIAPAPPRAGAEPEEFIEPGRALAWFAAEHLVLTATVNQTASARFDTYTCQLAWTLAPFLDYTGRWRELADVFGSACIAAERLGNGAGRAYVHRILGRAWIRLGRHDDARAEYRQALDACRSLGDQVGEAHTHLNLGWLCEREHDYHGALDHTQQALVLYREAEHRAGQASALNQTGWYLAQLGDYEQTLAHCRQALTLQRDSGHRHGQASTWHTLGFAYHHLAQYHEAAWCYRAALDLHRTNGDRYREAETLTQIAESHHASGDAAAAANELRQALTILDQIQHPEAEQVRAKLHDLNRLGDSRYL
jgi:tetratricopeptide (TPR) repeat protein